MSTEKYLFIVESPTKVHTIQKLLPSNYIVVASTGHIRQLEPKPNSFSLNNGKITFKWVTNDAKLKNILQYANKVNKIILATDPDREGEAIAYHLLSVLREHNINVPYERVCYSEITKSAIDEALKNSRNLNDNLINAYFARIIFDHAIGFSLSPMLWKVLKPFGYKQSAGRVQSVALRLIAEKEILRRKFNTHKYYSIESELLSESNKILNTNLNKINCEYKTINSLSDDEANNIYDYIDKSTKEYTLIDIIRDVRNINPQAPFMTTTLQQEASISLNMRVNEIMQCAQKLYELGLITYHRSDSTYISADAIKSIRSYINTHYNEYLSVEINTFDKKSKNAQEAHECIRPTNITVKTHNDLTQVQQELYTLIRNRTLECQMKPAKQEYLTYLIANNNEISWEIKESHCIFESYNVLYAKVNKTERLNLIKGLKFQLKNIIKVEHETKPPKRYTEASLIKQLEIDGIGRPSTMSNIFETLKLRDYIIYKGRSIEISFRGLCVSAFLSLFFANYINYSFTSEMEKRLDDIINGIDFIPILENILNHLKKETNNIDKILKTTTENITINDPLYNNVNLSFDNIYNLIDILHKIGNLILVNPCNKCKGELELNCNYHFYSKCKKCNDENNLQIESHQISDNISIINNGKYRYVNMEENNRIYLPNCVDHNLTEENISDLMKLPYQFEYNNKKFTVNKTFRNFYIRNEENQYFNFDDTKTLNSVINFNDKIDNIKLIDFICHNKVIKYISKRKYDNNKDINIDKNEKPTKETKIKIEKLTKETKTKIEKPIKEAKIKIEKPTKETKTTKTK